MTPFCAICTDTITGEVRREPLGRAGAMVAVCDACADDAIVARSGPDRGYPVPEERAAPISRAVEPARRRLRQQHGSMTVAALTPGWIRVLVPIRGVGGRTRDQRAAKATLRGEPWYADLRYLGTKRSHFVFERPDRDARRRELDTEATADALGALERFRVAGGLG